MNTRRTTEFVRVAAVVTCACWAIASHAVLAALKPVSPRKVIQLDGRWQVEPGGMGEAPQSFTHSVVVPGLVDMAEPPFRAVGKPSDMRQAFWYRRTFRVDGTLPQIARLKIHKARYGTRVILNGNVVGEHLPCFTPAYLNVREYLKGGGEENELVIRVGAHRESLPPGMPTGWDFEKYLYIPGIDDSVQLILTSAPYIKNIQTVPDIESKSVRVVAEIESAGQTGTVAVQGEIREAGSGRNVAVGKVSIPLQPQLTADFSIPIDPCRLWSPEDPFLYELALSTGSDAAKVRFGMRSFRFEPGGKYALLNGQRYFLRGSNVTMYRFFEDAERKDRPWRAEWVRRLHRQFKSMHWNSLRYCIGFPPDFWYDIADEEGFLIQDEFPIWTLGSDPEKLQADRIIPEYGQWMRERWNHPCVVIWDAQNESSISATGQALRAVRDLDLSNRPWENGWAAPQRLTDCVEAHPYLFIRAWQDRDPFRLSELATTSGVPPLREAQRKLRVPIIINEYGWLWLTRDGHPTCLTTKVYESLLGPDSTVEQRRVIYAKYLAALTEFWRAHRECAGVLHFCGLGYSRPGDKPRPEGGATSDHFIDLQQLTFEPYFAQYVGDAFSPVGLMLDFWEEQVAPGVPVKTRVYVVNDLQPPWQGQVRLRVVKSGQTLATETQGCRVNGFGREILGFTIDMPAERGSYSLVAELVSNSGKVVRSIRDFRVTAKEVEPRID